MKLHCRQSLLAAVICATVVTPALAAADDSNYTRWQESRLFEPTQAQLQREADGQVMIYHKLPDTVVERALTEQHERIESMMFTNIIVTDEEGAPLKDPVTGEFVAEDDGCD